MRIVLDTAYPAAAAALEGSQHFFRLHQGKLAEVRALSESEAATYADGLRSARSYNAGEQMLAASEKNYDEFAETYVELHRNEPTTEAAKARASELAAAVNRRLINYLSTMRLYLDAIEARLERFHGQDSNVYRAFRDACKHEFDTYCSYRFAYKLRNYAQHLGMPISHIRTNASQEHAGDPIEFAADISFNARELLAEGGDIWGPVRRDLERASESIAVLTVFGDFPNHLRRIRNAVLAVERPFLEKLKASVSELLDCVPSGPGVRQIGEYVDADGRLAIDFVDSVHALLGTLQPAIVDDEE